MLTSSLFSFFFFFNDTATTEIYTLSLHDALPISDTLEHARHLMNKNHIRHLPVIDNYSLIGVISIRRSEEHTSELQSLAYLVCRLLLEKKKKKKLRIYSTHNLYYYFVHAQTQRFY